MLSLCKRRWIKLKTAFGLVFALATVSFFVFFRMLERPLEMRKSVKDRIQTWDNLAHLVEIGSFSRHLSSKPKNVSSYEDELLSSGNLTDFLSFGNSSSSRIIPLNSSNEFLLGQTISFRIDVFDGHHLQHFVGGDDIRVWFMDQSHKKAGVSSVIDLKNGSYIAHFKALFNGSLDLHASIAYPREYLQVVMSLITRHLSGFTSALFEKDNHMEVTLCAPFYPLPNYTRTCDFTKENNNVSWYCGQPFNENLTCSDWTNIRPLTDPSSLPLSQTEQNFINKLFEFPAVKLIPTSLKVHVREKGNRSRELPPCNRRTRPLLQSWLEKSPRGWIQNSEWCPSTCKLMNVHATKLAHCLSNSTVLLIGDFGQQGIFEAIHKISGCDENTQTAWPHSSSCSKPEWNFKMKIIPHEYPVNVQSKSWIQKDVIPSLSNLDAVPSEGKYIILLHQYLSLSPYHPQIYKERIQKMRDAIDRLLERNPSTFVAVRGPHIAIKRKSDHLIEGDNFVPYFSRILVEEYKKLWRDVLFIDGWDISVAIENSSANLPNFVQFEMARLLLAYACDFFN